VAIKPTNDESLDLSSDGSWLTPLGGRSMVMFKREGMPPLPTRSGAAVIDDQLEVWRLRQSRHSHSTLPASDRE
jgi:hypothetical protein